MAVLLLHAGATLAMVGVIWFVQVVHYPLFELASERRFERFTAGHQRRTAFVVIPLTITEAATVVALLVAPPLGLERELLLPGLLLLAMIWLSTALLQMPLHRRLKAGRDRGSRSRPFGCPCRSPASR